MAIGFLENNVPNGAVDGRYWPPANDVIDNTASDGPREYLWIFDIDYSESPAAGLTGDIVSDSMPVMYWLSVARDGQAPFATGDEFLINPAGGPVTNADVFEFTAPAPTAAKSASMMPAGHLSAIADLRLLDSLALRRYRTGVTDCSCPCHADPACDGIGPDIFDVSRIIEVAFRGEPSEAAGLCGYDNTDVDCSGATDIFDVVRIVDVAFRNADPVSTYCDPCNQP